MARLVSVVLCAFALFTIVAPPLAADEALDRQVRAFLDERADQWRDLNVPESDGAILYDMIVEHGFTDALEIGTSTGHSTIWIAWALAKTGGRLVTVEVDPRRHAEAVANIASAGLSDYVDLRLGDAHELVPALDGPFDFVFSDADKGWYVNYFDAAYPKLTDDACFAAHNVTRRGARNPLGGWRRDYFRHVSAVEDMQTDFHPGSRAGLAVSCKL